MFCETYKANVYFYPKNTELEESKTTDKFPISIESETTDDNTNDGVHIKFFEPQPDKICNFEIKTGKIHDTTQASLTFTKDCFIDKITNNCYRPCKDVKMKIDASSAIYSIKIKTLSKKYPFEIQQIGNLKQKFNH